MNDFFFLSYENQKFVNGMANTYIQINIYIYKKRLQPTSGGRGKNVS